MKTITFTLAILISLVIEVAAQSPQAFKYQAVVRDATGEILQNQAVGIRIAVHDSISSGTVVYQETFVDTTNQFGLVNLEIGHGTPVTGNFSSINWGSNSKFLEVEIDASGGTNYQFMGTSQLLSVPYALYSGGTSDTSMWNKNGDVVYYSNGNVGVGTSNPQGNFHIASPFEFAGVSYTPYSLINDLQVNYSGYTGSGSTFYEVKVVNQSTSPNLVKWSNDNGTTWSGDVYMAASGINVGFGVTVGFDTLNGHFIGDSWTWVISESTNDILVAKYDKVQIGKESQGAKLEVAGLISQIATGQSVFLGEDAGRIDDGTNNQNAFVGYQSGYKNNDGYVNSFLGYQSGYNNASGAGNTFIGNVSGYSTTSGGLNTIIGDRSGYSNTEGNHNTYLGYKSGFLNATGSDNVCLGYKAGYYETGSNKLYIHNAATAFPLIYGEFDNNLVSINGKLGVGTSSPTNLLELSSVSPKLYFNRESSTSSLSGLYWRSTSDSYEGAFVRDNNTGAFELYTDASGSTPKMIVTDAGYVGIGTSNPISKLSVGGAGDSLATISGNTSHDSGYGVFGTASGSYANGVRGECTGSNGSGVKGYCLSYGNGVLGLSWGKGVSGYSYGSNGLGVSGYCNGGMGVQGESVSSTGVYGLSSSGYGVYGEATNSYYAGVELNLPTVGRF